MKLEVTIQPQCALAWKIPITLGKLTKDTADLSFIFHLLSRPPPNVYNVFLLNINEGTTLKCSEIDNQVVRRVGIRLHV